MSPPLLSSQRFGGHYCRGLRLLGVWLVLIGGMGAAAHAQSGGSAGDTERFTWGPVSVAPLVSFATLVDTNVFNESDDPKQDVVIRAMPQAQGRLSLARVQVQFLGSLSAIHFRRYRDQNSIDVTTSSRVDVDLSRVIPYVAASLVRTRERPGLEIDIRPLRLNHRVAGGVAIRLSSKTSLVLGAFRERLQFADDAVFRNTSLAEGLDRRRDGTTGSLRFDLTPITAFAFTVENDIERFTFSPLRNAESIRVLPSVEFSPGGLLGGRAAIGYRQFRPTDVRTPPFAGAIAALELHYVHRDATQFAVRVNRDVTFSYDPAQPYFLLTAVDVSITRYVTDRLRLTGSFGKQRLDYRQLESASPTSGRRDHGLAAGLAVLYVTNHDVSFGVTVDRTERSSGAAFPGYHGLRTGVVINYGH